MVKKIVVFLLYSAFFMLSLIYFIPKENIYYFLEHELKQKEIILSGEEVKDSGFVLGVKDIKVYFNSINSAKISKIDMAFFVVYNSISVNEIKLTSVAKSFVPLYIDNIHITYSILNPLNLCGSSNGKFGSLKLRFNILENTLHMELKPSKLMLKEYASTLKNLNKLENGEFVYDKTF